MFKNFSCLRKLKKEQLVAIANNLKFRFKKCTKVRIIAKLKSFFKKNANETETLVELEEICMLKIKENKKALLNVERNIESNNFFLKEIKSVKNKSKMAFENTKLDETTENTPIKKKENIDEGILLLSCIKLMTKEINENNKLIENQILIEKRCFQEENDDYKSKRIKMENLNRPMNELDMKSYDRDLPKFTEIVINNKMTIDKDVEEVVALRVKKKLIIKKTTNEKVGNTRKKSKKKTRKRQRTIKKK